MPKVLNFHLRNRKTQSSFGEIVFNADGIAEVSAEAAVALSALPGWSVVEDAPMVLPATPGGPGYTIEAPTAAPKANDVAEVSDRLGNVPEIPPAHVELAQSAPEEFEVVTTTGATRKSRKVTKADAK